MVDGVARRDSRDPRLPAELCGAIIDYVAAKSFSTGDLEDLVVCALVCHAWTSRVRLYLRHPDIYNRNAVLCSSDTIHARPKEEFRHRAIGREPPITHLIAIARHRPSLQVLRIHCLDLLREDPGLFRASTTAKSIQHLYLQEHMTQDVGTLARFITSFPSLHKLTVDWHTTGSYVPLGEHFNHSERKYTSNCSPKILDIELVPSTPMLVDRLVNITPSVSHLKSLTLRWNYDERRFSWQPELFFRGVRELLYHCGQSLEELWLDAWDAGTDPIHYDFAHLVSLSPLVNLRKLGYKCLTGNIARYACLTLKTVPFVNKITHIAIRQDDYFDGEADELDVLFASERFQTLLTVRVEPEGQGTSFTELLKRRPPFRVYS
ncbi:hypothetical protein QCA50_014183 [Cerrena zonata]|uniref:F-box domain-containing protein n=1 Tax=Cerrena zonata TaxID=2478898 RepID=A0AAW0FTB4_9APHY